MSAANVLNANRDIAAQLIPQPATVEIDTSLVTPSYVFTSTPLTVGNVVNNSASPIVGYLQCYCYTAGAGAANGSGAGSYSIANGIYSGTDFISNAYLIGGNQLSIQNTGNMVTLAPGANAVTLAFPVGWCKGAGGELHIYFTPLVASS